MYYILLALLHPGHGYGMMQRIKELSGGRILMGPGTLYTLLEDFLGFSQMHKAFLFGAGSLGGALLCDSGLQHFGLEIVAAFDVNPQRIGTAPGGIPVFHTSEFERKMKEYDVRIGVLTVPIEIAQEVTDMMVQGGIRAVWNFTPFRIRVPEHIVVQNTSLYAHLALMFNRLNLIDDKE